VCAPNLGSEKAWQQFMQYKPCTLKLSITIFPVTLSFWPSLPYLTWSHDSCTEGLIHTPSIPCQVLLTWGPCQEEGEEGGSLWPMPERRVSISKQVILSRLLQANYMASTGHLDIHKPLNF